MICVFVYLCVCVLYVCWCVLVVVVWSLYRLVTSWVGSCRVSVG